MRKKTKLVLDDTLNDEITYIYKMLTWPDGDGRGGRGEAEKGGG